MKNYDKDKTNISFIILILIYNDVIKGNKSTTITIFLEY